MRFGFAIVYVKDIQVARRYYADTLGLRVEREAPTFVQFEHFAVASDAPLGAPGEPELYWLVDDAEAAYRELGARSAISRPLESKPFGKVFGVRDPDGGTRFVLELAKNRPSRAVETPADVRRAGEALFTRWTAMWNGNVALAAEIVADGFWAHLTSHAVVRPEELRDAAAVARWVGAVRGRFDDMVYAMEGQPFVDVERRTVTCPWLVDGVYAGRTKLAEDVAGRRFRKAGVDILRFDDGGRVIECWTLAADVTGLEPWPPVRPR